MPSSELCLHTRLRLAGTWGSNAAGLPAKCGSVDGRMSRFVVDCGVVLHLASEGIEVPAEHELLAPTLLRSQTLSALHEAVHAGEIPPDVALDRLTRIRAMPIRLLGDAVLRRRAWDLAEQLGWARPTTPSTLHSLSCRQTRS